jgi:hypothetical protein
MSINISYHFQHSEKVLPINVLPSFCVHYLCLIGRVYVFYVGHVDKSSLYETLFHCNILSKHHHHLLANKEDLHL